MNALDPYNIAHPAEYYQNVNMTLSGLVSTVAHPDRALKDTWQSAKKDPSEFGGRVVLDLLGTKGAGAARGGGDGRDQGHCQEWSGRRDGGGSSSARAEGHRRRQAPGARQSWLAQATGPDGTTLTILRDRFGLVRSETVDGRELTYGYDEFGRRTSRTTPTGATTTWTYDATGRRTGMTVSGRTVDFTYDAAGRELTRRIGETVTLHHTFDSVGRLTAQSVRGADDRSIQHRAYTYRADGNLTGIDDRLSGTRHFDLDAAGRVTAVHAANWMETYAYDEAGNQSSASWPSNHPGHEATGPRMYKGTRITHAGKVRYEHDALGRVSARQKPRLSCKPDTWRYEWDVEDHLTSATTPDGTRWRYTYDPLGRRTAKLRLADDGCTVIERTDFTWDGTTLCEQTTSSSDLSNPVILTWDHQGLRPIAQTERITAAEASQGEIDSRFFAIVTDLVGTPSELVDEQGEIAWRTRRARNTIFCVDRGAAEVKRSRDLRVVEPDGVAPALLARSLSVVGTDGPGQLPLDHPQHPDRRRIVAPCGR
ncbi:RHS domain-containing protein [Streptomyces sp. NPDC001868]|uniref:RHS domain-containing protein n=1 Tax=Streptomyces sp. NPDC001868 TaxID=3154401 RepID=UPI0033348E90